MKRREFIAGLGGAVAWPLAARAQQAGRVRRIGVLMSGDENDPLRKSFVSALTQALANLGWIEGRKVRMDLRWYGDDINRIQVLAPELVGLQPDIIVPRLDRPVGASPALTPTNPSIENLLQEVRYSPAKSVLDLGYGAGVS
jgi:putative ABC transport system substrate-binding protein